MGDNDAFALGRSNLNGFLFADIGIECSGMPLSVISALARQGLDPWHEAGRLARLPRPAAAHGLARLIATMPASPWPMPDATAIAARLVALLPRLYSRLEDPRPLSSNVEASGAGDRQGGRWLLLAILAVAIMAGVTVFVAPRSAAPTTDGPVTEVPTAD